MAEIEEILSQRTDLSTFLVHLTKDGASHSALDVLKKILGSGQVKALSPFGHAVQILRNAKMSLESQHCVCFTETPLVHLRLLLGEIKGRSVKLQPFGIALPKKLGRTLGLNPVWYINMTPGAKGGWLSEPWNDLIDEAIANHGLTPFEDSPVARLTPFVEQMGTWKNRRKEFWWEREWRKRGNLLLPPRFIIIAPESKHVHLRKHISEQGNYSPDMPLIDANWSLEQIIGGLAGFKPSELGL